MEKRLNTPDEKGFLLVESMVALAVLSIGIIGLTASQLTASRNNYSALLRTEAVRYSSDIVDRMRANVSGVIAGEYNFGLTNNYTSSGSNQAGNDIEQWMDNLINRDFQGFNPMAGIDCQGGNAPICTITIQWDDSRASQASDDEQSGQAMQHITHVNL